MQNTIIVPHIKREPLIKYSIILKFKSCLLKGTGQSGTKSI